MKYVNKYQNNYNNNHCENDSSCTENVNYNSIEESCNCDDNASSCANNESCGSECSLSCESSCHQKPSNHCECIPDNCCKGEPCHFDASKARGAYTFLNLIFDDAIASGTPVIVDSFPGKEGVTSPFGTPEVEATFKSKGKCCHGCTIESGDKFTIKKSSVEITLSDVTTGSISINGEDATVPGNADNRFNIDIPPLAEDDDCNDKCLGTKANILIEGVTDFAISYKVHVCGLVDAKEGTCEFDITFSNTTAVDDITETSALFASDVCIPDLDGCSVPRLNISYCATAQLLNPTLTFDGTDYTLDGKLLLTPVADLSVFKNTKVCINAVYPCK